MSLLSFFSGPGLGAQAAQPVVAANTAFALDLYGQLKSTPGNVFFSPYSISMALAVTSAGTHGETAAQIAKVLHADSDSSKFHSGFGEVQHELAQAGSQPGIELNIANALWAQAGHPFLASFLEIASGIYGAKINSANFALASESTRKEINNWVTEATKEKIHDILPSGSLTDLTRLVLVNAMYFKGNWARPFDKSSTSPQKFHLSMSSQVEAPLMHHFDEVRYLENSEFQGIEMPYEGGRLSMMILLPRRVDGCASLEQQFHPAFLDKTRDEMKPQRVEIFLPRFKLESGFDLLATLEKMGMHNAFSPNADFSAMDGSRNLYITGVFHKAWCEVNEEGTEAAAATAIAVAARAVMKPPPPPPIFRADHPFVFLIRDTQLGSVLFMGRLSDPTK